MSALRGLLLGGLIGAALLVLADQALNLAGEAHAIHIGGFARGETALVDLPESWSEWP